MHFPSDFRSGKLAPMRRATTVILCILLGAIASGASIGIFLKFANDDRERLAKELADTVQKSNDARQENQTVIQEANKKLLDSNAEVGKAQALIKSLQEERDLLATAKPLTPPSPSAIRGWSDVVALDLGVSLKLPTGTTVQSNDKTGLTLAKSSALDTQDPRWFSLMPYDAATESELLASLATSTPVSYLLNGHILTGYQGTFSDNVNPVLILRVRKDGTITHLLWIRNPNGTRTDAKPAVDVLSTMRFAS
jgi:hypothetical protein